MKQSKCLPWQAQRVIGQLALAQGTSVAARTAGITRQLANYYKKKVLMPNFRPYIHGHGPKRCKPMWLKKEIVRIAEETATLNCNATLKHFQREILREFGMDIKVQYIAKVLRKAGYSYKKNSKQRTYKFTEENQLCYRDYIGRISEIDRRTIYYLDESHFSSKALTQEYGWGLKGKRRVQTEKKLPNKSFSVTLITTINEDRRPTFISDLREESNNCHNFGEVLIDAIEAGFLVSDSILVLDNASIHKANDMLAYIGPLLAEYNITMMYLPTYSPELNPCEKCFNQAKMYVSKNRKDNETVDEFKQLIIESFNRITRENMQAYYDHCIDCHFSIRYAF